ncbi:MAG: RNA polymerase sigma factor [Bacteroidota bacterium]
MELLTNFYEEERGTLVKKLSRRAGSPENAEDVVQEAFTRALKYVDSYDKAKREFGAWFNTILNNALRDFKRDEKNYGMSMEAAGGEEEVEEPRLDVRQERREVRDLIFQKGEVQQEILRLYYILNYTPKDIQAVTEHPRGTILSTITRFQQEVMEKYGEA